MSTVSDLEMKAKVEKRTGLPDFLQVSQSTLHRIVVTEAVFSCAARI